MKSGKRLASLVRFLVTVAFAALAAHANAQGFAALVSPPRFELSAKPGSQAREVIEITNASNQPAKFKLRTSEWTLDSGGAVKFDDALAPGSCRPWVAIERREITVSPGGKYRYRFEVAPPADAKTGECRFAILVEGDEQTVQTGGGVSFPVAGRLGVIVYVTIGEAQPQLSVVGSKVAMVEQQPTPVIQVKNEGNAHGRISAFLSGTDTKGNKLEFTTSTLPILPGETRDIAIVVRRDRDEPVAISYPITIRGKLEWGENKSTPFEQTFSR
jgi:hypothetical protein